MFTSSGNELAMPVLNIDISNAMESTGVTNGEDSDSVEFTVRWGGKVCRSESPKYCPFGGVGERVIGGKVDEVLAGDGTLDTLGSLDGCFICLVAASYGLALFLLVPPPTVCLRLEGARWSTL